MKNEHWTFQNPEGTTFFSSDTGNGPTDGDGAKPVGLDPEATDAEHWEAWTYVLPAAPGYDQGTASFLTGNITQSHAEEVTGETGDEALREVLDTDDYEDLRDVATSLEVTAP